MNNKIFYVLGCLLIMASPMLRAQGSIVTGKVLDNTGQPAPYAAVMLMQNETVINGAYTDDNGIYSIQPVDSGEYDIKVQVLETAEIVRGVLVLPKNLITTIDVTFKLKIETETIDILTCNFHPYPIKKDSSPSGIKLDAEEVQRMADRRLSAPASLATGVYVPIK